MLHVLQGRAAPTTILAAAAVGLVDINAHGTLGCFHPLANSLNRRAIKGDTIQILWATAGDVHMRSEGQRQMDSQLRPNDAHQPIRPR